MMFPLFSILRREAHFAQPPSQFVLLHLKRAHLMEWVRAVVAAALGTRKGADLPRLLMQQETPNMWNQTCAALPCDQLSSSHNTSGGQAWLADHLPLLLQQGTPSFGT